MFAEKVFVPGTNQATEAISPVANIPIRVRPQAICTFFFILSNVLQTNHSNIGIEFIVMFNTSGFGIKKINGDWYMMKYSSYLK